MNGLWLAVRMAAEKALQRERRRRVRTAVRIGAVCAILAIVAVILYRVRR